MGNGGGHAPACCLIAAIAITPDEQPEAQSEPCAGDRERDKPEPQDVPAKAVLSVLREDKPVPGCIRVRSRNAAIASL
jgi:hypothetical protein